MRFKSLSLLSLGVCGFAMAAWAANTSTPGTYLVETKCPQGSYCPGDGQKYTCPENSNCGASSTEVTCKKGYQFLDGKCWSVAASLCCPEGQYSQDGFTECLTCPTGTTSPRCSYGGPEKCFASQTCPTGTMKACPEKSVISNVQTLNDGTKCYVCSCEGKFEFTNGQCTCPKADEWKKQLSKELDLAKNIYVELNSLCTQIEKIQESVREVGVYIPYPKTAAFCGIGRDNHKEIEKVYKNQLAEIENDCLYKNSLADAVQTQKNNLIKIKNIIDEKVKLKCIANYYASGLKCVPCPAGTGTNGIGGAQSKSECIATATCSDGYMTSKGCVKQCSASTGFPYVLHDGSSSSTKCVTKKECLALNYVIVESDGSCTAKTNCNKRAGWYADASTGTCKECAVGTYSALGASKCTTCAAGSYSAAGASSCTKCAAGTYSAAGAMECTKCPAGTYAPSVGRTTCVKCPTGYTSEIGATTCTSTTVCTVGQYIVNNRCVACPVGYYCDGKTKTVCPAGSYCPVNSKEPMRCAAGTYSASGASKCTTCAGNTYSMAGAEKCMSCGTGTANATHTACNVCAEGQYLNGSACVRCPAGYACTNGQKTQCTAGSYSVAGSTECTKCPAGTYTRSAGHTTCVKCPTGYISEAGATTCVLATTCLANQYIVNKKCTACPAGYYCNGKSKIVCPTGSASCTSATDFVCKTGYYNAGTKCMTCPSYSVSCTSKTDFVCKDGYYKYNTSCRKMPTCSKKYYLNSTENKYGTLYSCKACPTGATCDGKTATCPKNSTLINGKCEASNYKA